MANGSARVCLSMIVKDEAHVIERCLASIRPVIDTWVIVDTGSTDATAEVVAAALAGVPGELVHRPWVDFGHNRTEALELARGRAEYALVIDADEVWHAPEGFALPEQLADGVQVLHVTPDGTTFYLTTLMRLDRPWRYEGVLHEVATCDEPHTVEQLVGPRITGHFDSARNQRPVRDKYLADAAVLRAAVENDPDNARHVFYLAQSYRDAGELDEAIEWYGRRILLGGWAEEVWYSMYQIARLRERRGDPAAEVINAYLASHDARPQRAEPLCDLARVNRSLGRFSVARLFADAAVSRPRPDDILFLDESAYGWRAKDELSLAAYYSGDRSTAVAVGQSLVDDPAVPERDRERIRTNLDYFTGGGATGTTDG